MSSIALALTTATIRAARSSNHTALHRAADPHLTMMLAVVHAAFKMGRQALGNPPSADDAANAVKSAIKKAMPSALLAVLRSGGEVAVKKIRHAELRTLRPKDEKKVGPFQFSFDVEDPKAIEWAQKHAGELADGLSKTTRERVAAAIAEALEGGGISDAIDEIADAIGDDARAELIARTEVMTAANEGQRQGWDQAVEDGLLPPDAQVQWIATSGCCDACDDLDGETRDLDGEYPDPGGDGPPLHPNCRCTEGIVG